MFDTTRAGLEPATPSDSASSTSGSRTSGSRTSAPPTSASRDRLRHPAEPRPGSGEVPMAELTDELCALASQLAATTCRWLLLLAEFDRREGWTGHGIRSCAQWLSWRCSLSLSTAYEQLRVARSLPDLPRVRAQFAAGRLSYSKVRAITRLATPDSEEEILGIAQSCTASQLDRLTRGYRRAISTEDEVVRTGRREVSWHWADDGYLVLSARLPPEHGATLLAALSAAGDSIESEESPRDAVGEGEQSGDSSAEDSAGVPAVTGPDPCREMTPEDLTPRRPAEQLVSPTTDPGLLRRTRLRAAQARAADALTLVAETALTVSPAYLGGDDRYRVLLHVDLAALSEADPTATPDPTAAADPTRRSHLEDGPAISAEAARRMTCHAGVVALLRGPRGQLLDIGRRSRTIPPAIGRALRVRDHGRCRFPGCQRRKGVEAHHIVHWAHGGPTRLDNLVLLCRLHHWLVHEGGFAVRGPVGQQVEFRRPDGGLLPEVPDTHQQPAAALADRLHGEADALTPAWWYGEPLRLAYVVSAVLDARSRPTDSGLAA